MKKVLLLFFLFFSFQCYAQLDRTAFFDFNVPSSLTPSIVPGSTNGEKVSVTNKVFTNGLIKINFQVLNHATNIGSQIATYVNPYTHETTYFLRLSPGTLMTVSSLNGSTLDAIDISQMSSVGTMGLYLGQSGELSNQSRHWEKGEENVTSVTFVITNDAAELHQMTVSYTEPSAVLNPISYNIQNNDTVPFFKSLIMRFSEKMTIQNSAGITISPESGAKQVMNAEVKNDSVILSVVDSITKDGKFKIYVPARCFRSVSGYENMEINIGFTVREPRNTLIYDSISLKPDKVLEIPKEIVLYYPKPVKLDTLIHTATLFADNDYLESANVLPVDTNANAIAIRLVGTYTDYHNYSLVVPERVVHLTAYGNTNIEDKYDRWNPEFSLNYIIDGSLPEPDPDPQPEDSETMKLAKKLLADTDSLSGLGVLGYPVDTCSTYHTLMALTSPDLTEIPTDEQLQAAITDFYNETCVTMPIEGKWYMIAGINREKSKLYLTDNEDNTAIILGRDSLKATAFKATAVKKDTVVFQTKEGRFLHVLTKLPYYDLTSDKNISDEQNEASLLSFKKFEASEELSVDNKELFGLFTMRGTLGCKDGGTPDNVYSMLSFSGEGEIRTDLNKNLVFSNDRSSAFVIAETADPTIPKIIPDVYLKPGVVNNDTLTMQLVFSNVKKVRLLNGALPYFSVFEKDSIVQSTAKQILTPLPDNDSIFIVHVNGLAARADTLYYKLVMPIGTFDFSQNPEPVEDSNLNVSFAFKNPPAPVDYYANYGSLPEMWGTIPSLIQGFPVADTDLLEVYYYVTAIDVYPNKNASCNVVKLSERWKNVLIAQGHFESVYRDGQYMLKIVYDENSLLSDKLPLNNGDYTLTINRAAYGDENFNKRQNGDTSIQESDCRVNQRVLYNNLTIDNNISGINKNVSGSEELSDGKYIINGKLIIIKGGKKFTPIGIAL